MHLSKKISTLFNFTEKKILQIYRCFCQGAKPDIPKYFATDRIFW